MKLSLMSVMVATGFVLISATSAYAWQNDQAKTVSECEALMKNSEHVEAQSICQAPEQSVTWGGWFSGKSRSTQFHFLDLFELLFASGESNQRDYNRPISG
ncbi:hypothetical protein [Pseudidiomarina donghaiensis]|uniref:DUF3012 domain-containing protein n=1 Tax=Pseudidiomarina donghaiensis TaxID=519452 RepID=A0A432XIH3_9GAMM|nr:hypothetical protein [Pseudidiomarina donghaiensis]RUO48564.1 hypothetical protein CWE24_07225 [Pseudidiomarina donghaiensis]SFV23964.1 hypothetical protein SAMN04488139_2059 [Pseudidiomarina donghaiensis]